MNVRSSVATRAPNRRATAIADSMLPQLVAAVAFFALWFGASAVLPRFTAPSPLVVFESIVKVYNDGVLIDNTLATFSRTLIGLSVAMILGVAVGVVMGSSTFLDRYLRTWVTIGLAIPGAMWILIMVLWVGANMASLLITIVLITAPYVVVNVYEGVKDVDKGLLDMARAFGVPGRRRLTKIILPAMVPFILGALRQATASCWRVTAVVEVFAATSGVGYMIRVAWESFQVRTIIAWAIMLALIIVTLEYAIIVPVQRRLLSWRPEAGEIF